MHVVTIVCLLNMVITAHRSWIQAFTVYARQLCTCEKGSLQMLSIKCDVDYCLTSSSVIVVTSPSMSSKEQVCIECDNYI